MTKPTHDQVPPFDPETEKIKVLRYRKPQKMIQLNLRIDETLHYHLKRRCFGDRRSINATLYLLIVQYCNGSIDAKWPDPKPEP